MYTILYDGQVLYDPRIDDMSITDAKLTGSVNSISYLDFTIPPKHPMYGIVKEEQGIVTLKSDDEIIFRGVINGINPDIYGYKAISCASVLTFLNDTRVRPYSTLASDGLTVAPSSIEGYFQWLIDQHNLHCRSRYKQFEIDTNQGAALDENDYIYRKSEERPTTLDEITNKIIDELGGYIFIEYKNDRNVISLYSDIHSTNSQIIDYSTNVVSLNITEKTDSLYTAILPLGGTPENTDSSNQKPITIDSIPDNPTSYDSDIIKSRDVIYSQSGVNKYGYREYYYSNTDIMTQDALLKASIIQLKTMMYPEQTIEVKAVDLSIIMKKYKHLQVGELVRVRLPHHDIDIYMIVSSIDLDLNNPSNSEFTLGDEMTTLTGQSSRYSKTIQKTINKFVDDMATTISEFESDVNEVNTQIAQLATGSDITTNQPIKDSDLNAKLYDESADVSISADDESELQSSDESDV